MTARRLLVTSLCACLMSQQLALSETAVPEPSPLKLEAAIEYTVDKNDLVKNSQLDVGIAKDRVKESYTHLLPQAKVQMLGAQLLTPLNFSFDKGVFGNFRGIGPIPDQKINVSTNEKPFLFMNVAVVQPILQLPRIGLGVRQNKLALEIAQQKLRAQRIVQVNQLRHAYYKALELKESLNAIEATLKLDREVMRTTGDYLKQRTVLPGDAIDAERELANAEYEAMRTRNALASQKEEINHLLGREPQMEFDLVMVAKPQTENLDLPSLQLQALANRSEVKQSSLQAKQLDLEHKISRLKYLPDVSLVFDYLSMFGTQVIPQNVAVVGLFLNWDAIDWGRKHWESSEKRKQLAQVKNTLHDMQNQIVVEVNTAARKLQEAGQYLHVTELGQQLAAERLRVAANRYKQQASLLKDVLQAEKDLAQANNQYTQSLLALWTARADFEKAMGQE